tara:strand:- start:4866 stop:5261 length:396 start_codon:yes stop_codon:yes gene_type:complete
MTKDIDIIALADLDKLRSAPKLDKNQTKRLLKELVNIIYKADWLTIGIMSPSLEKGINAVRRIEKLFNFNEMKCKSLPNSVGPIFLKANQRTGEIHARIEYGLGEGILITCHDNDNSFIARTYGPFPLDFF